MNLFINRLFEDPRFFFAQLLIVMFSVSLHEYMHARIALAEGDDTAAAAGHLTLNPFRQMGWWSLLMLLFLGICWGSVPVNPAKFRRRASDFLVSLAGPVTNLALGIAFVLLFVTLYACRIDFIEYNFGLSMLWIGSTLNFALFLINILPIPGLDGWHLVARFIPYEKVSGSEFIKGATLVLLVLAITFIRYIFMAAEEVTFFLASGGVRLVDMLGISGR